MSSIVGSPFTADDSPPFFETDEVTIVVATRNRPDRLAGTAAHHRAPVRH